MVKLFTRRKEPSSTQREEMVLFWPVGCALALGIHPEPGFDSEGFINYQKGFANDTFNTLIERIKELNKEIMQDKSLGKGFCIGHSYFCNADDCSEEWMKDVVDFDILPMLSEYWFDESAKLQRWENILHGVFQ